MSEFFSLNMTKIWLVLLVICVIVEAISFNLTTIWAALACVPLIFLSFFPIPPRWQLLIFSLLTVALIVFTRPFAQKKLKIGRSGKTNVSSLPGESVIVVKDISDFEKGWVKSKNGVIWSAQKSERPFAEVSKIIKKGTICQVKKVVGNTLIVEEIKENEAQAAKENL